MSSQQVMVKRSRGKKQQEETEKQQHVIVTKSNLFKGFTIEGVLNYFLKQSTKLGSSSCCGRFLAGRTTAPSTVTFKLAGLFPVVISNSFCSKTCKESVFGHYNVLLFHCFFLLLFSLLLLTIIHKKGIPNVVFLCDFESSLHP